MQINVSKSTLANHLNGSGPRTHAHEYDQNPEEKVLTKLITGVTEN